MLNLKLVSMYSGYFIILFFLDARVILGIVGKYLILGQQVVVDSAPVSWEVLAIT